MTDTNKMRVLIDWLSFTIPVPKLTNASDADLISDQYQTAMSDYFGWLLEPMTVAKGLYKQTISRRPYAQAEQYEGLLLGVNPKLDNMLFEFSGEGCQRLRKHDILEPLIKLTVERLSRVDLAVDVETDALPSEIITKGISERFKSNSVVKSGTGETVYLGSRKSVRYARVYRYNHPHPRHKYLRFEFVYRKRYAKDFGRALINQNFDLLGAMVYCKNAFGLKTDLLNIAAPPIEVDLTPPNKQKAGTLIWLTKTVAPAFRKLVSDQIITDPETFIKEYFLS